MQTVLFTKLFLGRSVDEIAEFANDLAFDGIDLLIRNGFQVEPGDPAGIGQAVNQLKASGLTVPMATTDVSDPANFPTEAVFAGCAEAGIGLIRLGYWKYDGATRYADVLSGARRNLDELTTLAAKHGVRIAIQLHGDTIHASGAQTYNLLEGHDPAVLSAYPDPGNQTVQDGRDAWRFTFDVLEPWLSCIGVKNGGWFAKERRASGQQGWESDWLGIADGMVPWDEITAHLVSTGFDGLLSFHSHYEWDFEAVREQTRKDVEYVRSLIAAAQVPA